MPSLKRPSARFRLSSQAAAAATLAVRPGARGPHGRRAIIIAVCRGASSSCDLAEGGWSLVYAQRSPTADGSSRTAVRLVFVASLLLPGPQILAYLVCWAVFPKEPSRLVAPPAP